MKPNTWLGLALIFLSLQITTTLLNGVANAITQTPHWGYFGAATIFGAMSLVCLGRVADLMSQEGDE